MKKLFIGMAVGAMMVFGTAQASNIMQEQASQLNLGHCDMFVGEVSNAVLQNSRHTVRLAYHDDFRAATFRVGMVTNGMYKDVDVTFADVERSGCMVNIVSTAILESRCMVLSRELNGEANDFGLSIEVRSNPVDYYYLRDVAEGCMLTRKEILWLPKESI